MKNYKVGTLKRYGLCYEDLRQINPRLIYCSITGFGQDGPDAHRPGYDFMFQGIGGLMSITGERDGEPGAGPMKVGIAITDVITGMYASLAISAAIIHSERTGMGQYIDMALLDSSVALNTSQATMYLSSGNIPERWGNAHPQVVPYQAFATSDGHIILALGNDSQFERFCRIAGRPEVNTDPLFKTNPQRVINRHKLIPLVADIMKTRTKAEWLAQLGAERVPCGPINNMKEVFENPQVKHRKLRVDVPHKLGGIASLVASPMRLSLTPVEYRLPPPILGEHTESILKELLGKNAAEIEALKAAGIV